MNQLVYHVMSEEFDGTRRAPLDIRRCLSFCVPCSLLKLILWGIGGIIVIILGICWYMGLIPGTNTNTTVSTIANNSVELTNNNVEGDIVKIEKKTKLDVITNDVDVSERHDIKMINEGYIYIAICVTCVIIIGFMLVFLVITRKMQNSHQLQMQQHNQNQIPMSTLGPTLGPRTAPDGRHDSDGAGTIDISPVPRGVRYRNEYAQARAHTMSYNRPQLHEHGSRIRDMINEEMGVWRTNIPVSTPIPISPLAIEPPSSNEDSLPRLIPDDDTSYYSSSSMEESGSDEENGNSTDEEGVVILHDQPVPRDPLGRATAWCLCGTRRAAQDHIIPCYRHRNGHPPGFIHTPNPRDIQIIQRCLERDSFLRVLHNVRNLDS